MLYELVHILFHRDAKERLAEISTEKRSQLHKQETERYGSGLSGRKVWGGGGGGAARKGKT